MSTRDERERAERRKRFADAQRLADWPDVEHEATAILLQRAALAPLGFDGRRRVLWWACAYYGIDPERLGQ